MTLKFGSEGGEVTAWQRQLNALGAKPSLEIDGDFGAETETATKAFQRANSLLDDGEVGDLTRAAVAGTIAARHAEQGARNALALAIRSIAATQIGTKEESPNRGAGIEKYWSATSYPDGMKNREPWCAAFVCWVVIQAFRSLGLVVRERPTSPAVAGILAWARTAKSVLVIEPESGVTPLPGDLVIYAFGGRPDHVGIVDLFTEGVSRPLGAIEGNTNAQGGREGIEVARQLRTTAKVVAYIRFAEGAAS